jgi:hypothetical protein
MISAEHTVEDVLRLITDRAAFLRHFGNSAAVNHDEAPDARTYSGLADAAAEIEAWARAIHDALDIAGLGVEIGSNQNRKRATKGGRQS